MRDSKGKRDQIPGGVREALEALRAVPEVDPVVWEEGRRSFITKARAYSETADTPEVPRGIRGWWAAVRGFLDPGAGRTRLATAALRVTLILAVVLVGSVGTVSAARNSLPGSPLYAIKMRLELWEMTRAQTPDDVSQQALVQSQQRVEEATRLADVGKPVPGDVAVRFQEQLSLAVQASRGLAEPERLQARTRISETLQNQMQTMTQIATRVQGEDEASDDQAILAMIRTMQETQAQLGPGHGRSDDPGEGEPVQNGPDPEPNDNVCAGPDCPGNEDTPGEITGNGPGPGNGNGPSDDPTGGSPRDDQGPTGPSGPSDGGNGPSEPPSDNSPGPGGRRSDEDDGSDASVVPNVAPSLDNGAVAPKQSTSTGQAAPVAARVAGQRAGSPRR